ncbi:DNA mismatch repair protein MutS [compost metagenome]
MAKINSEFGEKPKKFHENFDMSFVKAYYKSRKENEKFCDSIDELTWNDLDMDSVFKRTNYTSTTLGESYLYYKYREVSYDNDYWNTTEELIKAFNQNKDLRNSIKFNLMNVGKLNDTKLIHFIYNPTFSTISGYYKYPLLAIGLILSILTSFIVPSIGVLLTVFFVCANILFYQSAKLYLEENFDVMIYLLNNIKLCHKLSKVKDKDFDGFREKLETSLRNFKKLKNIKRYSSTLDNSKNIIFSDSDILLQYIKMLFMVDIIAYQNISKILEENKEYLYLIYDLVAQLDFALSIVYYRKSVDKYVNPEFTEDNTMELEDIYHPLLDDPIKNSIHIDKNIIFTGSNASGKSTFIKAVALNSIMAQSLNTALCSKYKCRFSKVVTSMAIRDNILEGDSYFIAEIKSLKRLLDSLNGDVPILAFIDEILKGTNTIERISASASILKYAKTTNARILVATHDIELTQMIESGYDNYHFRETVTDDDIIFDYTLKKGPSTTRNAIKLLKTMNFKPDVVVDANSIYDDFIENQKWSIV